jgi:hypothetical protein
MSEISVETPASVDHPPDPPLLPKRAAAFWVVAVELDPEVDPLIETETLVEAPALALAVPTPEAFASLTPTPIEGRPMVNCGGVTVTPGTITWWVVGALQPQLFDPVEPFATVDPLGPAIAGPARIAVSATAQAQIGRRERHPMTGSLPAKYQR